MNYQISINFVANDLQESQVENIWLELWDAGGLRDKPFMQMYKSDGGSVDFEFATKDIEKFYDQSGVDEFYIRVIQKSEFSISSDDPLKGMYEQTFDLLNTESDDWVYSDLSGYGFFDGGKLVLSWMQSAPQDPNMTGAKIVLTAASKFVFIKVNGEFDISQARMANCQVFEDDADKLILKVVQKVNQFGDYAVKIPVLGSAGPTEVIRFESQFEGHLTIPDVLIFSSDTFCPEIIQKQVESKSYGGRVTVLDSAGQPIPNVAVELKDWESQGRGPFRSEITDEHGRIDIMFEPGDIQGFYGRQVNRFVVRVVDYQSDSRTILYDSIKESNVKAEYAPLPNWGNGEILGVWFLNELPVLEETVQIVSQAQYVTVTVRDAESQSPMRGETLERFTPHYNFNNGTRKEYLQLDSQGKATFRMWDSDPITRSKTSYFRFVQDGHEPVDLRRVDVTKRNPTTSGANKDGYWIPKSVAPSSSSQQILQFEIDRSRTLEVAGIVRDRSDGRGIPSLKICFFGSYVDDSESLSPNHVTAVALTDLSGRFSMIISEHGYLQGQHNRGKSRIRVVDENGVSIGVNATGEAEAPFHDFTIEGNSTYRDLEIDASSLPGYEEVTYELVGTLLDPEGKPISRYEVESRDEDASLYRGRATTNGYGRFILRWKEAADDDLPLSRNFTFYVRPWRTNTRSRPNLFEFKTIGQTIDLQQSEFDLIAQRESEDEFEIDTSKKSLARKTYFQAMADSEESPIVAAEKYLKASVQEKMVALTAHELKGHVATQWEPAIPLPPQAAEHCSCRQCTSAFSKFAYLSDLLHYAEDRAFLGNNAASIAAWDEMLGLSIESMPVRCSVAQDKTSLARVAVEALRRKIRAAFVKTNNPEFSQISVYQNTRGFAAIAYHTILGELQVSTLDLLNASARVEAGEVPSERARLLASELGILVEDLPSLAFDVEDGSTLTESVLENVFGFRATIADNLSNTVDFPSPWDELSTPLLATLQRKSYSQSWYALDHAEPDNSDDDAITLPVIIDPDLVAISETINHVAAEGLLTARRTWLKEREEAYLNALNATESIADPIHQILISSQHINLNGYEDDGQGHTVATAWEETLAPCIDALHANEELPEVFATTYLTREGLRYLGDLKYDVDNSISIADARWKVALSHLLAAEKESQFSTWKQEELAAQIAISPEIFRLSPVDDGLWFANVPILVSQRLDITRRRDWLEVLKSRTTTWNNIDKTLAEAVKATEERVLPLLRHQLVEIYGKSLGPSDTPLAKRVSNEILLDVEASGTRYDTRIDLAIEAIQTLIFRARVRSTDLPESVDVSLDFYDFDEIWEWLGDYTSWQSAIAVLTYPENFLGSIPRRNESHLFKELREALNQTHKLTHAKACEIARAYSDDVRSATGDLEVIASCHTKVRVAEISECSTQSFQEQNAVVMVARNPARSVGAAAAHYWSLYFPDTDLHELWSKIDFESDDVDQVLGLGHSEGYVYVIYKYDGSKFAAKPYDLNERAWRTKFDLGDAPEAVSQRARYYCSESSPGGRYYTIATLSSSSGAIWFAHVDLEARVMTSVDDSSASGIESESSSDADNAWQRIMLPDSYKGAVHGSLKLIRTSGSVGVFVNVHSRILYRCVSVMDGFNENNQTSVVSSWKLVGEGKLQAVVVYERRSGVMLQQRRYHALVIYTKGRSWVECFINNVNSTYSHSHPEREYEYKSLSFQLSNGASVNGFAQYSNATRDMSESWMVVNGSFDFFGLTSMMVRFELDSESQRFPDLNSVCALSAPLSEDYGPVTPKRNITSRLSVSPVIRALESHLVSRLEGDLDDIQMFSTTAVFDAIEEYFFFAPLLVAQRLRESGDYRHALDWLAMVYDYKLDGERRRIYPILREDYAERRSVEREDWLRDPLDPHAIAGLRPKAYLKHVVFECVQSLVEWAKSEYKQDTRDSRARAHSLFLTAQQVLHEEGIRPKSEEACSLKEFRDYLDQKIGNDRHPVDSGSVLDILQWLELKDGVSERRDAIAQIQQAVDALSSPDSALVLRTIWEQIALLQDQPDSVRDFATLVGDSELAMDELRDSIMEHPSKLDQTRNLSLVLFDKFVISTAAWIGESVADVLAGSDRANDILTQDPESPVEIYSPTTSHQLKEVPTFLAAQGTQLMFGDSVRVTKSFMPWPNLMLCAPPSPLFDMLSSDVATNLEKLRLGLTFGGNQWTPPDENDVAAASALAALNGTADLREILGGTTIVGQTQYRYSVLVEIARRFAQVASQTEAAYFAALRDLDSEEYRILEVGQSLQLTSLNRETRRLQSQLARQQATIPMYQAAGSSLKLKHYDNLIEEGNSALENRAIALQFLAAAAHSSAAVASIFSDNPWANVSSNTASALSTTAGALQTMASFQRRKEEWILQRDLAVQEYAVGRIQLNIGETQMRVAAVEERIGEVQTEHARNTLTFLQNKFTSADLFRWLVTEYSKIYERALSAATEMAHLAYYQLKFERQAAIANPFSQNYAEIPSSDGLGEGGAHGITGSARLLRDLVVLEQEAVETNVRRLHMTKTFSVARLAPDALYNLTTTGDMLFETPEKLYDRDYPGHYHRIIEQVRVTIIALTPATEGIRASLSCDGRSRTTIEPTSNAKADILREEQRIAFSSPVDANGIFELNPQSELLRPFEGLGVETTFRLELPRAANPWDFRSIQDVLISVDYSAKHDHGKYTRTIEELGNDVSEQRAFSLRNEFVDAWYQFMNTDSAQEAREIEFELKANRFRPSLKSGSVVSKIVRLYVVAPDLDVEEIPSIRADLSFDSGDFVYGSTRDGVASSNRGSTWINGGFAGKSPNAVWRLRFPGVEEGEDFEPNAIEALIASGELYDLVFVVEYDAEVPAWPGTLSGRGL